MTLIQSRSPGGSTEAKQDAILTSLGDLLTELTQKYEGGAVPLDPATIAALQTVTATVSNFPTDYPDASSASLLTAIQSSLSGTLTVSGEVALDTATLAALETINAAVTNWPTEYPLPATQITAVTDAIAAASVGQATEAKQDALIAAINDLASTSGTPATDITMDVFRNVLVGTRNNQIEVRFDETTYTDQLSIAKTGGGHGGEAVTGGGQVRFGTGTTTSGSVLATSVDSTSYRPFHEAYFAGTVAWLDGSSAAMTQMWGVGTTANHIAIGYKGATFGIQWTYNGVEQAFIPQTSWTDPCDGSVGSSFTRNGVPEAYNPAFMSIFNIRIGWFGSLGFSVEIMSPDWVPVEIYRLKQPNRDSVPFLATADLPMFLNLTKVSGGTTDYRMATNCWAGGTTSDKARLSDVVTDNSLATLTQTVIIGKSASGGGTYVPVKVGPSGALETNASVSNFPTNYPDSAALTQLQTAVARLVDVVTALQGTLTVDTGLVQPLTDTEMRATPVDVNVTGGSITFPAEVEISNDAGNPVRTVDDYTWEAHASDQTGANAVLTFTIPAGMLVIIDVDPVSATDTDNYRARATVDGTTPTSTNGFVCRPGSSYLPTPTAGTVNVWAPTGVTVSVQVIGR